MQKRKESGNKKMDNQMDLSVVIKAIDKQLTPLESELAGSLIGDIAGLISPVTGVLGSLLQKHDKIKLAYLLRGLASDLNMERHLNELYQYVTSSAQRAYTVANVLRETIAAKTPKVCMIYGKILANHTGKQEREFTNDDIIVCNALENASDYDLDIFRMIMSFCNKADEKRIYIKKGDLHKYQNTFSWCLYTRLFYEGTPTHGSLGGYANQADDEIVKSDYIVGSAADLLLSLLNELEQIIKY